MGPTGPRPDRHDVDLEPAICLDAVRRAVPGRDGASLPAIQITFSVLIVLQTWLAPLQGWLVDRFGPKFLIATGAALTGLGFVLSAQATTPWALYLSYGGLCGFGTGIVYIGIIGPDGEMVSRSPRVSPWALPPRVMASARF